MVNRKRKLSKENAKGAEKPTNVTEEKEDVAENLLCSIENEADSSDDEGIESSEHNYEENDSEELEWETEGSDSEEQEEESELEEDGDNEIEAESAEESGDINDEQKQEKKEVIEEPIPDIEVSQRSIVRLDKNTKQTECTTYARTASPIQDIKHADLSKQSPEVLSVPVANYREYIDDLDTSDEEDIRNTVGNVPMNWYNEYSHLGYDWEGQKILKQSQEDQLDYFLKRMEDPNFWRMVKDKQTGQDVILSDKDVELIQRIESSKIPDSTFDAYAPWVEWFTSEVMTMPLRKFPEHKRSFLPSRTEAKKVCKMVHALKMGYLKTRKQKSEERLKKRQKQFYMLWKSDDTAEEMRRIHDHIPAPKRHLPGHAESYNPPTEYLFNKKELREWEKLSETPSKRKLHFVPKKYDKLLDVPAYSDYLKERFKRCLDLYLCPRARKMRLTIEAEDLLPKLPSPRDLQPFPTTVSIIYRGHTDMIRCISIDPLGQFLVSGSDDHTVKIWEIQTGRCMRTIPVGGTVRSVDWSPSRVLTLIAVATDQRLLFINAGVGDKLNIKKTDTLLSQPPTSLPYIPERVSAVIQWSEPTLEEKNLGILLIINHFKEIRQVTWHGKGDYCATVVSEGGNRSVVVHQLSTHQSQLPFTKSKGLIQCVLFHPKMPYFFVATQKNVRIYDLIKQTLYKKLYTYAKWISSMAIHPGGDNLLVGTYDRKMLWFDLDLSSKPYKTLRLHKTAVRSVAYHKRYPLFASCSDDRSLIISHGMVYNDLLQNALIVPLKLIRSHEAYNDFGMLSVLFHPYQPWVFTSGADGTVVLYT